MSGRQRRFPSRARLFAALPVAITLGLWGCQRPKEAPQTAAAEVPQSYRCPMHPQVILPHAGECPICGMKLVPVQSGGAAKGQAAADGPSGYAAIELDAQRQQLIGLKTAKAERALFSGTLRTTGRVTYDETRIHHIHTRYEAYIEHLYADFTGKFVRKGEALLSLYSPDVLSAEQEYLIALHGPREIAQAARQKLLLWNIAEEDIRALEQRGEARSTIQIYAPISGYVLNKTAVHGMRVKPEDSLFDIVDLSHIWVLADIYEHELPRLRLGQSATMTLAYWPNRSWPGRTSYIYPSVDPKTRTVKVRLEVDNAQNDLKAEMYANVEIAVAPRTALAVPEDAVLETGTRRLVFLARGQGRLEPREVTTGERAGGRYEIKSGLDEGQQVALGAAFLLDSESRISAALHGMGAEAAAARTDADGGPAPGPEKGRASW